MPLKLNLIIDIVLDFIYPTRCVACDKILEKSEIKCGFCKPCCSIIGFTHKEMCMICGRSLLDKSKELCPDCEKSRHYFDQARGLYSYQGSIKEAMYRFKYSNRRDYGKVFAREACTKHGNWIKSLHANVIIPVPMNEKKKRLRGYNQAEVFAKDLSNLCHLPYVPDAVIRQRDTLALKTLSPTERKAMLKSAFKNVRRLRRGCTVLLIDDIYTTGATVDEIASILKAAGVRKVYALFVCTGKAT